jgi:hypothetical protein
MAKKKKLKSKTNLKQLRGAGPFPPKHANGDVVYLPRGQLVSDVVIMHVAKILN